MRDIFRLLFLLSILFLTSCENKLTPNSTNVAGDLGRFLEIVDKESSPQGDKPQKLIVEFTRTAEVLPEKATSTKIKFIIDYIDSEGNVIAKETSSGEDVDALMKLNSTESGSVAFKFPKSASKAVSYKVTGIITRGASIFGFVEDLADIADSLDDDYNDEDLDDKIEALGGLLDAEIKMIDAASKLDNNDKKTAGKALKSATDALKVLAE